jgi:hypothetical protein
VTTMASAATGGGGRSDRNKGALLATTQHMQVVAEASATSSAWPRTVERTTVQAEYRTCQTLAKSKGSGTPFRAERRNRTGFLGSEPAALVSAGHCLVKRAALR